MHNENERIHKHHILPKRMGGTDDPSNIELISIPEHAERHRVLFETHGQWQDEVAWKALSGQIGSKEAFRLAIKNRKMPPKSEEWKHKMSERMKGAANPRFGKPSTMLGKTMPQSAKDTLRTLKLGKVFKSYQWEITHPNSTKEIITNLKAYCRNNKLCQSSMMYVAQGTQDNHKGYRCKKLIDNAL